MRHFNNNPQRRSVLDEQVAEVVFFRGIVNLRTPSLSAQRFDLVFTSVCVP